MSEFDTINNYCRGEKKKGFIAFLLTNLCTINVLLCACVGGFLFSGCNSTQNEIDEDYRSGVVLIMNRYLYTLTFPNGAVLYFADDGEGNIKDFVSDPDSAAVKCSKTAWGTGFFISNDGKIATNKHVASRMISDNTIIKYMKQNLKSICYQLEEENDRCEEAKKQCENAFSQTSDEVERLNIFQIYKALNEKIEENNDLIKKLKYIDPEEGRVEYHSELRVGYNGTFVHGVDDLFPCSLRDTSDKDLAIIQLNSKQTPSDKHVFTVPEENMLEHYSFGEYISRLFGSDKNEKLYMIGFDYGYDLAITDEGIYSLCKDGSVTRTENDRIMYGIPALPGSSGSPVLNRRGQLVAINFLGLRGKQNTNWGLKEKYLYDLIHKD